MRMMKFPFWLGWVLIVMLNGMPSSNGQEEMSLHRLRALGQAYMEQDDFGNAVSYYQQAAQYEGATIDDQANLGIALYHDGETQRCIEVMQEVLQQSPNHPHALYILGLAHKKLGQNEQAADYFQRAYQADQTDITIQYNLGLALSAIGQKEQAIQRFQQVLEQEPEHSAATYQLALAMRGRDNDRMRELLRRFQQLKQDEENLPTDFFDEGKYFTQIDFAIPRDQQINLTSNLIPQFERHDQWTRAIRETVESQASTCLAHLTHSEKRQNHLIISTDQQTRLLVLNNKAEILSVSTLLEHPSTGADFVDYDNDEEVDLVLYSPEHFTLLQKREGGSYENVRQNAGVNLAQAQHSFWADYDHEGDLDLFAAHPQGDRVFQNNGDGTFSEITNAVKGFPAGKSYSIILSDLDNDNDLDIIRVSSSNQLEVFSNQREMRFVQIASETVAFSSDVRLHSHDVNNDSRMEVVLLNQPQPGPWFFYWPDEGQFQPLTDYELALNHDEDAAAHLQSLADLNNDGYLDFLIHEPLTCNLLLNKTGLGRQAPLQFSEPIQLSEANEPNLITLDIDFDGDLDILAKQAQGPAVYENTNGSQNHSIVLDILGKKNSSDGFGSKIEIKHDLFYQKKELAAQTAHLGLGERDTIDVLRLTWPNGIFQNIINATAGQILSVTERAGYAGSCPFIYAWNGGEYEFIADGLSTGPIGLYVGGGFFPPRSYEYVRVRGDQLQPKNGFFQLLFREELRELTYLDKVELLSVHHPKTQRIFSTDQFTVPPFPEFQLVGMSNQARPPLSVKDQHGRDVTELIAKRDARYPRPFAIGRYDGVGKPYSFTIDLGDVGNAEKVYLFMTGYVDWPNSSVARSLEQHPSMDFVLPYLQVKNSAGEWETVIEPMGFPAGKLKTVPLDLSHVFLTEDRSIRIVSTLQIHWDQILVDSAPILEGFAVQGHPLRSAHLHYGGFSHEYTLNSTGPHWYDYSRRSTNQRWDYALGNYTRYGDVLPLLQGFDDQYVIFGPGDEVAAQFDDRRSHPNKPVTYFLHLNGWVKDLDYSTAYGQTVEPLPFKGMTAYPPLEGESYPLTEETIDYLLQYNTRQVRRQNEPLRVPQSVQAVAPNLAPVEKTN